MEAIRSKNLISVWFACPTAGPPNRWDPDSISWAELEHGKWHTCAL
jgi:hypothetical protein